MNRDDFTDSELTDGQLHWHSPAGFFTSHHADQGIDQGRPSPTAWCINDAIVAAILVAVFASLVIGFLK